MHERKEWRRIGREDLVFAVSVSASCGPRPRARNKVGPLSRLQQGEKGLLFACDLLDHAAARQRTLLVDHSLSRFTIHH